jgi:thiamine biosynthesis lipoprotein
LTAVATGTALELRRVRFRAMGTDVEIGVVDGADDALDAAQARVLQLERRWSRFIETSDIGVLNRSEGHPVVVSRDTLHLVSRAIDAWHITDGRFDPTVGASLVAYGYDKDFVEVAAMVAPAVTPEPAPGLDGVELLPETNVVRFPAGVTFDPGGIGKGLAADLVVALLLDRDVGGVLVNIGGDLRVAGEPPDRDGWVVTVPDPIDPGLELLRFALPTGAVATSSRLQRRWTTSTGEAHHLFDPSTGRPADSAMAVTVVASEGWLAEAWSKALFLTGPAGIRELEGVHALITANDGTRAATPALEAILR